MIKPRVILSACFDKPFRYNGGEIRDEFVDRVKHYVEPLFICPEVEIGLGIPRAPLVLVKEGSEKRLLQPLTGRDLTEAMEEYLENRVAQLREIDGAILKAKSPTCGVSSVKLYKGKSVIGLTSGLFADHLGESFPNLPIEDELRLRNRSLHYHFLVRVFAFADLRELVSNPTAEKLVEFHTRYKFLLLTYNQEALKVLGRLVACGDRPLEVKVREYSEIFLRAFNRIPSRSRHANTLYHITGHFSKRLNHKERRHLLSLIERYKEGKLDISAPLEVIKSLAFRFEESYITLQRYVQPFPEELSLSERL